MTYRLDFFTQYGQFYIADEESEKGDIGSDFWNEIALTTRLALSDGILGIALENDECKAKVEVSVLESSPICVNNIANADHVVEGSIRIPSGSLQIQDCPNSKVELEIAIDPSDYRCRIYAFNLNHAYEKEPKDHYRIEIWKEPYKAVKILKQWLPNY